MRSRIAEVPGPMIRDILEQDKLFLTKPDEVSFSCLFCALLIQLIAVLNLIFNIRFVFVNLSFFVLWLVGFTFKQKVSYEILVAD